MNNFAYLGVIRAGALHVLGAEDGATGSYRLTALRSSDVDPPETAQIPLDDYADHAVLVRGIARDGWIRAATVVEVAGPLVTFVIEAVFGDRAARRFPGG
jgi:hypothetical protein